MRQRKKILFCITKGNFGGAQRYVLELATRLPKDKFEAVVACGNKEGKLLIERLAEAKIRTIVLENSEREISMKRDWQTLRDLVKTIKEEEPDVVHFNSSKIGLLGSIASLYFKIFQSSLRPRLSDGQGQAVFKPLTPRFVFTSHGWAFNERHRSLLARVLFYALHYLTVLFCEITIAVSEKTKKDISWLPFLADKIKVVHNGIGHFKMLPKKEAAGILVRESSKEIIILTLAELHHNKGLDIAMRGISLLSKETKGSIKYYIAGEGEERPSLEKLVIDLNLAKTVRFLGVMDDGRKILSGADIFLFPSRTENLPFAVLEAGLAGLPVIATSVGGIPEIIRDMQNGILVHPQNPKEIAEAILYLMSHREKRKEFGNEIKNTVSNFFSADKMITETVAVYQTLLKRD